MVLRLGRGLRLEFRARAGVSGSVRVRCRSGVLADGSVSSADKKVKECHIL